MATTTITTTSAEDQTMESPITKEQRLIYNELVQGVKLAQERMNLWMSTALAGHGITEANVTEVTETAIVYSVPDQKA